MSSEHDEQVALFNELRKHEDKYPELKWIFAIPNGGHRHISVAKKMKAEGVRSGIWDIYIPFRKSSCSSNGILTIRLGMWIEMKFGKNKLTDNQIAFRDALEYEGYEWSVCYSAIEACHAIGEYLDIQELKEVE